MQQQIKNEKKQKVQIMNLMIFEKSELKKDCVSITKGKWTEQASDQVGRVRELGAKELHLDWNGRASIVKEVAHIHFTRLTVLTLRDNDIDSIEELPLVSMPLIEHLNLDNNHITSVAALRKAIWPHLETLSISNKWEVGNNKWGGVMRLAESHFPRLDGLLLCERGGKANIVDASFLGRMETASMFLLQIKENTLAFHRSLERVLQQRWAAVAIS